jgi:hypothetical protein
MTRQGHRITHWHWDGYAKPSFIKRGGGRDAASGRLAGVAREADPLRFPSFIRRGRHVLMPGVVKKYAIPSQARGLRLSGPINDILMNSLITLLTTGKTL